MITDILAAVTGANAAPINTATTLKSAKSATEKPGKT